VRNWRPCFYSCSVDDRQDAHRRSSATAWRARCRTSAPPASSRTTRSRGSARDDFAGGVEAAADQMYARRARRAYQGSGRTHAEGVGGSLDGPPPSGMLAGAARALAPAPRRRTADTASRDGRAGAGTAPSRRRFGTMVATVRPPRTDGCSALGFGFLLPRCRNPQSWLAPSSHADGPSARRRLGPGGHGHRRHVIAGLALGLLCFFGCRPRVRPGSLRAAGAVLALPVGACLSSASR
jgi:hypothetical protein